MSDIFISYARSTEAVAHQIAETLRARGHKVWRDDELPAHRNYSEVIEERLRAAKAVVVVWSAEALGSQWVRAEADVAREAGTLVQLSTDGTVPPLPFNQIQCADLRGWSGDPSHPGWTKVADSVASLAGPAFATAPSEPQPGAKKGLTICVLPFVNMSGDSEQEYFSDGITEDIITDLSKVSALDVVARNTAFAFKGQIVDIKQLAKDLGLTHVIEGSVRKAGGRVRITAQLIDGKNGNHVWADRFDRELDDIFAIQDEISKAIVGALKLTLLPKEQKAIETRGTSNPDAYDLYLMARNYWVGGNEGDRRREDLVIRICEQALELDPDYAKAWTLKGLAQAQLKVIFSQVVDALPAANRALDINPDLAEAHALKALLSQAENQPEDANRHIELALADDPNNFDANRIAGQVMFKQDRLEEAIPYFEKAVALDEGNYHDALLLTTCYEALGRVDDVSRVARLTLERAEKRIRQDPGNGAALAAGVYGAAFLGDADRARSWADRVLLLDPDNFLARYNLACAFVRLGDTDRALDLLAPYFANASMPDILHAEVDPDLDTLREDSRFVEMMEQARARTGIEGEAASPA
ncbi:TIR domain-containing protein [Sphingomicrobium nitratireducens]|uniref:TIR domain-containing protein n=1 Tax=Sphingomicrobium nitratireducens TaxID=2964666 RepID=UPI00224070DE|nr:TIR domain-containing protein [Sphingomicrobium nitratireducens]